MSAFSTSNRQFAVARRATPTVAARRGTSFRYTTSEAGTAKIRIQRRRLGRRVGAKCVTPRPALRRKRRCVRRRAVGTLERAAVAGQNRVRFTGRIGTRALRPGRYRAVLTVTDQAGNRSQPGTVRFRIVRR